MSATAYEEMLLWSARMHRMIADMGGRRPPMAEVVRDALTIKVNLKNVYDVEGLRAAIEAAKSPIEVSHDLMETRYAEVICDCSHCRNPGEA